MAAFTLSELLIAPTHELTVIWIKPNFTALKP